MSRSSVPDAVRERIAMPQVPPYRVPVTSSKDHYHLSIERDGWAGTRSPSMTWDAAVSEAEVICSEPWVKEVKHMEGFPFTALFVIPKNGTSESKYFRLVLRQCNGSKVLCNKADNWR
jgi:hypothetical protein